VDENKKKGSTRPKACVMRVWAVIQLRYLVFFGGGQGSCFAKREVELSRVENRHRYIR